MPNKKPWKEKTEVHEKKKTLTKLVVGKDGKGFNVAKCRLVDDTLGDEFSDYFLLRNDQVSGVMVDFHHFKRTPPNIVYRPLSNIHKDEIKKKIT